MWLDWLVFCDCGFSLSALWWRRIRGLWKLPDRRDWLRGKLGLVLMGRAMFSKSLIQFSADGLCSLLTTYLGPNYGEGNEDNGNLLQKIPGMYCYTHCPQPCSRPPQTQASTGDSWTLMVKSGWSLVGSLLLSPGSWCTQGSAWALQESFPSPL